MNLDETKNLIKRLHGQANANRGDEFLYRDLREAAVTIDNLIEGILRPQMRNEHSERNDLRCRRLPP